MNTLEIKNLKVNIKKKSILNGVDLSIKKGQTVVIMGPNGSGKSTLAHIIMGDPKFSIKSGSVKFLNKNILKEKPETRAASGIFMAHQHPREIKGVGLNHFLFTSYKSVREARKAKKILSIFEFREKLESIAKELKIKPELLDRDLNYGFSGGEKKKIEMLQLKILEPQLAIFDETDSGLDVDALKIVGNTIQKFRTKKTSALIITHLPKLLKYIKPDVVYVMMDGEIVMSGGAELVREVEKYGYNNAKIKNQKSKLQCKM